MDCFNFIITIGFTENGEMCKGRVADKVLINGHEYYFTVFEDGSTDLIDPADITFFSVYDPVKYGWIFGNGKLNRL